MTNQFTKKKNENLNAICAMLYYHCTSRTKDLTIYEKSPIIRKFIQFFKFLSIFINSAQFCLKNIGF